MHEVADTSSIVLRGRCHERETLPFKTLDAVVDSLCKYLNRCDQKVLLDLLPQDTDLLCRMFPVLGSVATLKDLSSTSPYVESALHSDDVSLRRRAFDALRRLLTNVAKQSPLVIFIDDLQWGDVPGAIALADLFGSASHAQMLFVLAFRDDVPSSNACVDSLQLQRLTAMGDTSDSDAIAHAGSHFSHCQIQLGPLRDAEVRSLASTLIKASRFSLPESMESNLPEMIVSESSGMPFYVQELTQYAMGKLNENQQNTSVVESSSVSLNELLAYRIDSLAMDARQLVSMVAVAGQPVALKLACEAIGISSVSDRQLHELCINRGCERIAIRLRTL